MINITMRTEIPSTLRSSKKRLILRLFSTALCCFISLLAFADDIIVLRNGDVINAKVIEVMPDVIKYRKTSSPDGPIYSIEIDKVLSIKYENGEVDKFTAATSEGIKNSTDGDARTGAGTVSKAKSAADNDEQKAHYSGLPDLILNESNKKSKNFFPIMSFTEESVISTDELLVIIDPCSCEYYDGGWRVKLGYNIKLVNKTESHIYIDRARSFRRNNDWKTIPYFVDNQQIAVTHGNSNGGGIGVSLGIVGIGVGGSSASSYTQSHGVGRFLILAPKSAANLVDYEYVRLSETQARFKTVVDVEHWGFDLRSDPEDRIKQGEIKTYTEDSTPYSNMYYICYSTDEGFINSRAIEFELYAKYLIGAKYKDNPWSMMSPDEMIVKEVKKVIPGFWTDELTIVGMVGRYL